MLRPHKYLNPQKSVLNVSSFILKELMNHRTETYTAIREKCVDKFGDSAVYNLDRALMLLYLMGLVEYREKNDTIEYTGGKHEI